MLQQQQMTADVLLSIAGKTIAIANEVRDVGQANTAHG
jgi:hypothetical protein